MFDEAPKISIGYVSMADDGTQTAHPGELSLDVNVACSVCHGRGKTTTRRNIGHEHVTRRLLRRYLEDLAERFRRRLTQFGSSRDLH